VITGVSKVVVSVEDQESAKQFWTTRVGFDVATDAPYSDGERWIELSPPEGGPLLVLSSRTAGDSSPDVSPELPQSPLFFVCDDIRKTYRELTRRGVKFPTPPTKMTFGWWAMFEDDGGTRYALEQR
jgi:lactoylglutathione lyase